MTTAGQRIQGRWSVEQAKGGVLSEYAGMDPEPAFEAIRKYATDRNTKLSEVAKAVVRRTVSLDSVLASHPPPSLRR